MKCFRCGAPAVKSRMCWSAGIYWPINVRVYLCRDAPACPNLFLAGPPQAKRSEGLDAQPSERLEAPGL